MWYGDSEFLGFGRLLPTLPCRISSRIAAPLTRLTRKGVRFEWSDKCETSFQELKNRLTSAPVLALPDDSGEYVVFSDASRLGLGCVLMQHGMSDCLCLLAVETA